MSETLSLNELKQGMVVEFAISELYDRGVQDYVETTEDGMLHGKIVTTSPDRDGDIKVDLWLNEDRGFKQKYVSAYKLHHIDERNSLWKMEKPDAELSSRIEGQGSEDLPTTLNEKQKNQVQIQELRARTVKPGLLKLSVKEVISAANSQKWAIVCEHPVIGEIKDYYDKPLTGWSREYDLVKLLEYYGIGDGNIYQMQTKDVYVACLHGDPENARSWSIRFKGDGYGEDEMWVNAMDPNPEDGDGDENRIEPISSNQDSGLVSSVLSSIFPHRKL